jgi:hypothetical protein
MKDLIICLAVGALLTVVGTADAAHLLVVSEIWPGNEAGEDWTEDWFEVTNAGDTAWVAAEHGDLYFDDDSADWEKADLMEGVSQLAPGESAVFVDGGQSAALTWWTNYGEHAVTWPVGWYNGSGLGGGGDGVTLWVSQDAPVADSAYTLAEYPFAEDNGGQSYDTLLGAFSVAGNENGAKVYGNNGLSADDEGNLVGNEDIVASPGSGRVPEPGVISLMMIASLLGLTILRCR